MQREIPTAPSVFFDMPLSHWILDPTARRSARLGEFLICDRCQLFSFEKLAKTLAQGMVER